jgi:hypothetical protein
MRAISLYQSKRGGTHLAAGSADEGLTGGAPVANEKTSLNRKAVEYELGVLIRLEDETLRLLDHYIAPPDHPDIEWGTHRLRAAAVRHSEEAQRLLNEATGRADAVIAVGAPLPPASVVMAEYASGLGQLRNLQQLLLHVATAEGIWATLAKAAAMAGKDEMASVARQVSEESRDHLRWLEEKFAELAVWAMRS